MEPEKTILELKELIEEKEGIEVDRIKLLFGGKQLEDDKTIESYSIKEGYSIIMAMKMGKGKPKSAPPKDKDTLTVAAAVVSDPQEDAKQAYRARIENKMKQNQEDTSRFGKEPDPDDASVMTGAASVVSSASTYREQLESRIALRQGPSFRSNRSAAAATTATSTSTDGDGTAPVVVPVSNLKDVASIEEDVERKNLLGVSFGEIIEDVAEDKEDDDALSVASHAKRSVNRIVVVVGLLMIIVVAALASFFFKAKEVEPTNPPTIAPTIFIDTSIPVNFELMDKITFNNISTPEDFNITDSPQMASLMWLWDQSANKTNIIQQYVLGTFLAGLNGVDFLGDNMNASECTWSYIECEDNNTITSIDLNNLKLDGVILPEIVFLKNLTELHLQDNVINGTIPSVIGELVSLTVFNINNNALSGGIPDSFGNLTDLEVFAIGSNNINGTLPPEIFGFKNLKRLEPWGNLDLEGTLPDTINELESLEYLDLSFLKFSGPIPTTIGELTNLSVVEIGDTSLDGTIPTEIGNLDKIETLYFGFTSLTGTIPTEIGNMRSLSKFVIIGNLLTGSIPSEMGRLNHMEDFRIELEDISGKIPEELGDWKNLTIVFLCETSLRGSVPEDWCDLGFEPVTKLNCDCCDSKCNKL